MDVWGVRYQVADVNRSVAFYTQQLGFTVEQHQGPAFAKVSCGGVALLLSGPEAPAPVRCQTAGGRSRVDGIVWLSE
jgi:catechol 2,3-dioxygenase-like lactoylglutathione lyase family enzyme